MTPVDIEISNDVQSGKGCHCPCMPNGTVSYVLHYYAETENPSFVKMGLKLEYIFRKN